MADKRGHFLLENLTVGQYTLSIQGIGRFRLEVTLGGVASTDILLSPTSPSVPRTSSDSALLAIEAD